MTGIPTVLLPLLMGLPQPAMGKRAAPVEVKPVVAGAVTYRAPHGTPTKGVVTAEETATGRPLWEVVVFETRPRQELETDVQMVFITRLRLKGGHLEVEDEARRVFTVDLRTRKVRRKR